MATPRSDAERAVAFDRAVFAAAADAVVEHPYGVELRTPSLPLTRNLNGLYVPGDVDLDALPAFSGTEWRLFVEDHAVAERLAPRLATEGWAREAGVLMVHRGERPAPDTRVVETDRRALTGLRRDWLEAEIPRADIVAELLVADERLFTRTPTRAFTIDGQAMALLVGDGAVRMVEDVYTTPAARRGGLASALVSTAVAAAADAELVFLPTAFGGAAQRLYAQLGFADVQRTSLFWRDAVSG